MSGIPAGAGQLLGKRLGKFEILALLALGGTAEIYLARIGGAAGFEKYVVVKCLHDHLADDAEFVKMFLDEARLAAHLDHSNIVQTMELGVHEGRYYMVMEFLAGLSLAMIVRRVAERLPGTRIPVPLVLNILAQSCAGLHYAHEKAMNGKALNIVHRDISPQNLVVSFEGVVKIVDFGIAKAEMRETRTRSGTIKGKFAYMSPEQCVANNVDRRTDVFALGVIAHELLTGRRLFKRPSPYETYQAVMECDVKPPSMLEGAGDPALDAVIMRALTKDKEERYQTAEAFGDALLSYLHHRGIGSGPGDVSRFFDAHFGQELDEHSARMRELISGRDLSIDTGVSWGGDEPDEEAMRARAADSARRAAVDGSLADELDDGGRNFTGGLAGMIDDLGTGSRVEDDDEMPAERTRIESNPLERVNELERLVAKAAAAKGPAKAQSKAMPKGMPPSGALPLPSPPPGPAAGGRPGMPRSGRFSDAANQPTVIAAEHGVPPAVAAFGNAPTGLAPGAPPAVNEFGNAPTSLDPRVPPAVAAFGNAPTGLAPGTVPPSGPGSFPNAQTVVAPPSAAAFANAPTSLDLASMPTEAEAPPGAERPPPELVQTQIAPLASGLAGEPRGSSPGLPGMPPAYARDANGAPSGAPPTQPAMSGGYPVMNAELSAQIATGATVFPSDPAGAPKPVGHSGPRSIESLSGPQRIPDSGQLIHDPGDAIRAAHLMSPVGQHYPDNVDWEAAAAVRARAVPPWLLLLLFIGALLVAAGLTLGISKLVS